MKYFFASFSGAGPRHANEDALGIWPLKSGGLIAAVADGLGGMGGGAIASKMAIDHIGRSVMAGISGQDLVAILQSIDSEIKANRSIGDDTRSMATTLSVVCIEEGVLIGAHCGDTRVMIARKNGVKKLTTDHTEAHRLLERGEITRDEYINYPRKNVLYSALGADKPLFVEKVNFRVEPGDWIVIASDGVHQRVSTKAFRDLSIRASSVEDYSLQLQALLDVVGVDDNFSAVIIGVESD